MASATQSTCCSMETTMLDSTDGLPGPVIMKRLGKPADSMPEVGARPGAPRLLERDPVPPRMSTLVSEPVMASKPVA